MPILMHHLAFLVFSFLFQLAPELLIPSGVVKLTTVVAVGVNSSTSSAKTQAIL
ncbi:hypothetical protein KCP71_10580 [Salmonella enterica subsp. enterica]|nr:hypothetical protein KCP71_10580 [Salmonella enterica subsp. enterica]